VVGGVRARWSGGGGVRRVAVHTRPTGKAAARVDVPVGAHDGDRGRLGPGWRGILTWQLVEVCASGGALWVRCLAHQKQGAYYVKRTVLGYDI
jgi:hypothetical protein